ncbi:MAG: DUF234 domain-containing protein [Candidatus Hadarchaeales archaeon]
MHFWFRFFYKNYSLYERRNPSLEKNVKVQLNSFIGTRFEELCRECFPKMMPELPFQVTKFGRQWGKISGVERGKNVYDIDVVALNEGEKKVLFIEAKWSDLNSREAKDLIEELKQKAGHVQWFNDKREEFCGLIARKIHGKEKMREEGCALFDLADLERFSSPTPFKA